MSVAAVNGAVVRPVGEGGHALLIADGIVKRFGSQAVLRDLSCSILAGEIVLLLGSNGAGKSTFLRVSAGLLQSDAGNIGRPPGIKLPGYVGHEPMLYPHLTVLENLSLFAALSGASRDKARQQSNAAIDCWKLVAHAHKRVVELSRGLQMRVSLARALQPSPSLVLLDEPTSALDEESVAMLRGVLADIAAPGGRHGAVVIATHDIERLRPIATRIVLLQAGRLEADSTTAVRAGTNPSVACDEVIARYRKENR